MIPAYDPGSVTRESGPRPRLFELYLVAYCWLVSLLVLVFGGALDAPFRVIVTYLALSVVILGVARLPRPRRAWLVTVRDWYALPVIIWIFGDIASLNQMVSPGYYDAWVIGWEQALFGSQPALWLADHYDSRLLTELASIGFLSYFAVFPGLGVRLYRRPDRTAFFAFVGSVIFAFLVSYLFYMVFPVNGPCWVFAEADPARLNGWFFTSLSVAIHDVGMPSAAFPSGHVGVTIVALLSAWRWQERVAGRLIALSLVLLTFGIVYSGYHYAVDAIAGLGSGVALYALSRVAEAALGRARAIRSEGTSAPHPSAGAWAPDAPPERLAPGLSR